ncbi:MAG TPA: quinol:cytochrome C oxidoreductase [Bacteroidia bacterium]|nr:quinol:cytochrome C oxidoreductase [Bacteroidia bacterium]
MNYYTFSSKAKTTTYVLMALGLIAMVYGLLNGDISSTRFWANFLLEGAFFTFISLGAIFFMSLQYVAMAGWSVVVKRVYEAVGRFLPFGLITIFLVLIVSVIRSKTSNDIVYHWMHKGTDPLYDELVAKKSMWMNIPFVLFRTVIVGGIWVYMANVMRKRSIEMDLTNDYLPLHYKNLMTSAFYIIFFGITEQFMAWDWIMAIDANWHSTLFGWYIFDDMWLTSVIVTVLFTIYLRRKGLLQNVNANHMHNLGLWMFALSILWGYLWFFQFMFYWYTNIPDEVVYFQARIDHYRCIFWIMFCVNLLLPLIVLMTRDTKRNDKYLVIIGSVLLITHWLDAYIWIMPGSIGVEWHIGFYEIGLALGFIGFFMYVVLSSLAKVPIQVKNHPYLEESLHHHN